MRFLLTPLERSSRNNLESLGAIAIVDPCNVFFENDCSLRIVERDDPRCRLRGRRKETRRQSTLHRFCDGLKK
jgi:hypothetical protein